MNKGLYLHFSALIAIFFIVISNLRPAILGQKWGILLLGIAIYFLVTILIWRPTIIKSRIVNPFFLSYILIVVYVLIHIFFLRLENNLGAVTVLFMILFGYIPYLIGQEITGRTIAKVLIFICCGFGISYIITMLLALSEIYISLFTIDLETHTNWVYKLPIMFPFSPVYDAGALVGGVVFPRAIGFMREPGLYQMVLIIAFWMVDIYKFHWSLLMKAILITSLVFTFSTAGYLLFLFTISIRFYKKSKRKSLFYLMGLPFISGIFYFLLTTTSQFGLVRKFHNRSGLSRLEDTLNAIDIIAKHPLTGIGFHNRMPGMDLGINFLGTMAQIGIVGVIVFLIPYIYVAIRIRNFDIAYTCIWLSLFVTMLFSQPLYDKAFSFLILSFLMIVTINYPKIKSINAT